AVVGNENQTFAGAIEPTNGKDTLFRRNQIDYSGATTGVVVRRHYSDRLVDCKIQPLRPANRFPIDTDFLPRRINARAELGHGLPIGFDSPRADVVLAFAAAAEARGREYLL